MLNARRRPDSPIPRCLNASRKLAARNRALRGAFVYAETRAETEQARFTLS